MMFLLVVLSVMAMGDAVANSKKPNAPKPPKRVDVEMNIVCAAPVWGGRAMGFDGCAPDCCAKPCKGRDKHFEGRPPYNKPHNCPACDAPNHRPAKRKVYDPAKSYGKPMGEFEDRPEDRPKNGPRGGGDYPNGGPARI